MHRRAFTLVELLVVIAIIGLLSTIAVTALGPSKMNARNTKRKADLLQITKALELYYADNGAYPSTGAAWCCVTGEWGCSNSADSGLTGWIPNLAPTYMATLPRDPNTGKTNQSSADSTCRTSTAANTYLYRSIDGTDYKLLAYCTPEGTMSSADSFYDPARPNTAWALYTPGARNW